MKTWRQIQKENIHDRSKLAEFLKLSEYQRQKICQSSFPLNIPIRIARKIKKGTLDDPIFKQFVPLTDELNSSPSFSSDPVQESQFKQSPRLLHKYAKRALLIPSPACAMHCRYCFRKEFDYDSQNRGFDQELALLKQDTSLKEVILSGGDPLSLSDHTLLKLMEDIEQIPHIKRLRFHTRFPIGIPERICPKFLTNLEKINLQVFFVIHTNHPKELDNAVLNALKKVQKCGIPTLSQTVLLKGVNDSFKVLEELYETLIDHGVLPYYLHQLDKVSGASHFEVDKKKGRELIKTLRAHLSGFGIPRYVQEIPGEKGKTVLE